MTWRRAALYWVCFLALGVHYLRLEHSPVTEVAVPMSRAPFLTLSEEQTQSLDVRRGDDVLRCRRIDRHWEVVEPAGHTVPPDLIASLITTLTDLPDVEVVAEQPDNLASFGLDAPAVQLTLTPAAGAPLIVHLGNRNPAGTAVYAQRSTSPRVFLIGLNARYYTDLLFEGRQRHGS